MKIKMSSMKAVGTVPNPQQALHMYTLLLLLLLLGLHDIGLGYPEI